MGTVADPRALLGYPLQEAEAPKSCDAFLTAAGDPIPQLGEKEVLILIETDTLIFSPVVVGGWLVWFKYYN